MKIVDAVWEKRNLGVSCKEITISSEDTIEEVKRVLNSIDCEYSVVKCPSCRLDVYEILSNYGFFFVESIIHVTHNLKGVHLSSIQERINNNVTAVIMNNNDVLRLEEEIRQGMFYTDRVYLDPHFNKEQATNRYIGWLSDERSRGTEFFNIMYKNQKVGFFVLKEIEEGIFYPFLAGMYKNCNNVGIGAIFNYKPLEEAKRRNGRLVSTYISTNNSNTLKAHVSMGFDFGEVQYVFVKHLT